MEKGKRGANVCVRREIMGKAKKINKKRSKLVFY